MAQSLPLTQAIGGYIFGLLQTFIRFIFRLIYGTKGERVPPITDPILLESASSLARKIRSQEVSKHGYICYIVLKYLLFSS